MSDATALTAFDRDTAVEPLGEGAFGGAVAEGWSTPRGPNGGYIAAIVMRAMQEMLTDPSRPARSLTLHYLRPPKPGKVRIEVRTEREGRSLSSLSARMSQGGRDMVIALGAFSAVFPSAADYGSPAPDAPAPEAIDAIPHHARMPPISQRFELRPALGAPAFTQADEARTGGWLRLAEPRPLDATLLAMYADAWLPAPFSVLSGFVGAPTIDLTIHFRNPAATATVGPEDPVLVEFRSSTSQDGFFEEDGEIWSRDGVLLAQSRQLALLVGAPGELS